MAVSQVTNAELTGEVTYTYTAAPEPSAFAMLSLGAMGILFNRQYQRSRGRGKSAVRSRTDR